MAVRFVGVGWRFDWWEGDFNRMNRIRLCVAAFLCGAAISSLAFAQAAVDERALLSRARQSYYDLHKEGMTGFQCTIKPDWNSVLAAQRKANPEGVDRAISTLSQLLFTVNLSPEGRVSLTHNDLTGQNKEMMDALAKIYGGMEQMTSGFFDTWTAFVLKPPFPEVAGQYRLETVGPQYRLSYKDETADVVTTMGSDFVISDLKVTTPEFLSTIEPSFTRTPKGFLLSGYEAHYQSNKPEETTHLKVLIAYQEVDRVQMLQKLDLSGTYGATAFAVQLTFTGCQVTKKSSNRGTRRPEKVVVATR
jgi:hypothetical protein